MTFGPRFALVEPIHPADAAASQGWMGAGSSSERRCRAFRRWCDLSCRGQWRVAQRRRSVYLAAL